MTLVARGSQAPVLDDSTGRVRQKRRTRAAIVAAGRAILSRGETPTIALVADEADMTRTTVYRYFPSQESLLVELSVSEIEDALADLAAEPAPGVPVGARVLEVIDRLNGYVLENELVMRAALRHYQDLWLAAERAGEDHRPMREGRRMQWLGTATSSLQDSMPSDERRRLLHALCLVTGGETITALRDVCQLDGDEARDVAVWAASAILAAAGIDD